MGVKRQKIQDKILQSGPLHKLFKSILEGKYV